MTEDGFNAQTRAIKEGYILIRYMMYKMIGYPIVVMTQIEQHY